VKISRSPDNALMRDLLRELGDQLPAGTGLIVDAGYGWRDSEQALHDVDSWGEPALAWLEDPLLPEDAEGCAAIRRSGGHPVAVGDEVTDPLVLERLMDHEAVDVLRVDAVAIGGLTPASAMIRLAGAHGIPVSTHVQAETSVHLGVAVETFARTGSGVDRYDPAARLIVGGPSFDGGTATPGAAPGLGFDLDWAAFGLPR
jgi:L-alanine-DL-glutamate epimerase-like enolase superfamily enzyme